MSVISGLVGAVAGKKGADAQADAARDAAEVSERMFNQTRDDFAPWRQAGGNALAALQFELGLSGRRPRFGGGTDLAVRRVGNAFRVGGQTFADRGAAETYSDVRYRRTGGDLYGGFKTTPGYAFRVGEGAKAIERSAAARGGLNSGATMKALARFGQDIASEEYGNYLARLGGVAGVGQQATQTTGALGAQSANVQGNALMAAGNARASGYQAIGTGIQQGIQGIGQLAGFGFGGGFGGAQTPPFFPGVRA